MSASSNIAFGLGVLLFFIILEQVLPVLIGGAFVGGVIYWIFFSAKKETSANDTVVNGVEVDIEKSNYVDICKYLVSVLPSDIYQTVEPFAQFLNFVMNGDGVNSKKSLLTLISNELTNTLELVAPCDWYHLLMQYLLLPLLPSIRKAVVSPKMFTLAPDSECETNDTGESSSNCEDGGEETTLTRKMRMINKKYMPKIVEIITDLSKDGVVDHFVSTLPSVDNMFKDLGQMLTGQTLNHSSEEIMIIFNKLTNVLKKIFPRDDSTNIPSSDVTSIFVGTFACVKEIWEVLQALGGPILTEIIARQFIHIVSMWQSDRGDNEKTIRLEARLGELVCIFGAIVSENYELQLEEYRNPESTLHDLEAAALLVLIKDRVVSGCDAVYCDFLAVVYPTAQIETTDPGQATEDALKLLRNMYTFFVSMYTDFREPYVELCGRTKGPTGLSVREVFNSGYSICSRFYFLALSSIFGTSRNGKIQIASVLYSSLSATSVNMPNTFSEPLVESWVQLITDIHTFFLAMLDQHLASKSDSVCSPDDRERYRSSFAQFVRMILFYTTRHCCYEAVFVYDMINRFLNFHSKEIIFVLDKWNHCLFSLSTGNDQYRVDLKDLCDVLWEVSTTGQASLIVFMETFLSLSDETFMSRLSDDCLYCLHQFGCGVINSLYRGKHNDMADELTLVATKSDLGKAATQCIEIFQHHIQPKLLLPTSMSNLREHQQEPDITMSDNDLGESSMRPEPNDSPKQIVSEYVKCMGVLQNHLSDVASSFSVHSINVNPYRFRFVLDLLPSVKALGTSLHDTQRLVLEEHVDVEQKCCDRLRQTSAAGAIVPPQFQSLLKLFNGNWEEVRSENYEAYLVARGTEYILRKLLTNMKAICNIEFNKFMTTCEIKSQRGIYISKTIFTAYGKPTPCQQLSPEAKELSPETLILIFLGTSPTLRVLSKCQETNCDTISDFTMVGDELRQVESLKERTFSMANGEKVSYVTWYQPKKKTLNFLEKFEAGTASIVKSLEELTNAVHFASDKAAFAQVHLKLMQAMEAMLSDMRKLELNCGKETDQKTVSILSDAVIDNQLYLRLALLLFYCPLVFLTSLRLRNMIRVDAFEVKYQEFDSSLPDGTEYTSADDVHEIEEMEEKEE